MKAKKFDCIQMKQCGAELVRKKLEGKSPKEILAKRNCGVEETSKTEKLSK
jgi:hypothetical protein